MNQFAQIVIVIGIVGLVGLIAAGYAKVSVRRENSRLTAVADEMDLDFEMMIEIPPVNMRFFDSKMRKRLTHVFRAKDEDALVARSDQLTRQTRHAIETHDRRPDYGRSDVVEGGPTSTVVLLRLPFDAPHTSIARTGKTSETLASTDQTIQIGVVDVDERFNVTSADAAFVRELFDGEFASLMAPLALPAGTEFEFNGPWLLCIRSEKQIEQSGSMLKWARSVRSKMPATLADRYPLPR